MNHYCGGHRPINDLDEVVSFISDIIIPQYVENTGDKIEVTDAKDASVCYVYGLKDKKYNKLLGHSTLEPALRMCTGIRIASVDLDTISDMCKILGVNRLCSDIFFESDDNKQKYMKYNYVIRLPDIE